MKPPLVMQALSRPKVIWGLLSMLLSRGQPTCLQVEGLKLEQALGLGNGTWAALSGTAYEAELSEALSLLEPGDNFVDLGANIGAYSLRVAQKLGPGSRIVAVEPNPYLVRALKRNLILNQFDFVDVIEAAVGEQAGECDLQWRKSLLNAGSVAHSPRGGGTHTARVARVNMDEELERLGVGKIRLIKMDIEGSEPQAVHGLRKTLLRDRPVILFENSHPETRSLLMSLGYSVGKLRRGKLTATNRGQNLWAIDL